MPSGHSMHLPAVVNCSPAKHSRRFMRMSRSKSTSLISFISAELESLVVSMPSVVKMMV